MGDGAFFQAVYKVVRGIPPGRVMTYGQIAMVLGNPKASRIVGYAMRAAPEGLPCHRVVNKAGDLREDLFGGTQKPRLEAEGVPFRPDGRIDVKRCLWWG